MFATITHDFFFRAPLPMASISNLDEICPFPAMEMGETMDT